MLARLIALFCLIALAGCGPAPSKPAFNGTDITGADYARGFALNDPSGRRRDLAEFRGKAVTVFFGYTQCPDVCPTTLGQMGEVMRLLGTDSERVQVVFITVDPQRDTPDLLGAYMAAFDSRFLGLAGDAAATEAVAKEFRIFYRKSGDTASGRYTVDHSAGTYVFDPQGRLRLYFKHGEPAARLADDLKRLLAGE